MKLAIVEKKNFLSWTAMHIDFVMCNKSADLKHSSSRGINAKRGVQYCISLKGRVRSSPMWGQKKGWVLMSLRPSGLGLAPSRLLGSFSRKPSSAALASSDTGEMTRLGFCVLGLGCGNFSGEVRILRYNSF